MRKLNKEELALLETIIDEQIDDLVNKIKQNITNRNYPYDVMHELIDYKYQLEDILSVIIEEEKECD